jgi:transposase-like protein
MAKKPFTIISQLNSVYKNDNHSHTQPETCPNCGSANISKGAGLKPGQISLKCSDCRTFIGYRNLQELKRLKRRKRLTPCLELLEKLGLWGDVAVFVLGQVGGEV